jgi:hypothetical protein
MSAISVSSTAVYTFANPPLVWPFVAGFEVAAGGAALLTPASARAGGAFAGVVAVAGDGPGSSGGATVGADGGASGSSRVTPYCRASTRRALTAIGVEPWRATTALRIARAAGVLIAAASWCSKLSRNPAILGNSALFRGLLLDGQNGCTAVFARPRALGAYGGEGVTEFPEGL